MEILSLEVMRLPAPWTSSVDQAYRSNAKLLGISPAIVDGLRGFRVIWRPILKEPIPYRTAAGGVGYRKKSHRVKTRWFPIVGDTTEDEAFRDANVLAAKVYDTLPYSAQVRTDWDLLARIEKVKVRTEYAKPALNKGVLERAEALFEMGWTPRQVGERLGVDRSTASRWRKALSKQ